MQNSQENNNNEDKHLLIKQTIKNLIIILIVLIGSALIRNTALADGLISTSTLPDNVATSSINSIETYATSSAVNINSTSTIAGIDLATSSANKILITEKSDNNIQPKTFNLPIVGKWGINIEKVIAKVRKAFGLKIKQAAKIHNIDENKITAIIVVESGGNSKVISRAGCYGLMQLSPRTAKSLGLKRHELTDPYKNILAGTKYIKQLETRYNDFNLAAAAYNQGPAKVDRRKDSVNFDPEKLNYVKKVNYIIAKLTTYLN